MISAISLIDSISLCALGLRGFKRLLNVAFNHYIFCQVPILGYSDPLFVIMLSTLHYSHYALGSDSSRRSTTSAPHTRMVLMASVD